MRLTLGATPFVVEARLSKAEKSIYRRRMQGASYSQPGGLDAIDPLRSILGVTPDSAVTEPRRLKDGVTGAPPAIEPLRSSPSDGNEIEPRRIIAKRTCENVS